MAKALEEEEVETIFGETVRDPYRWLESPTDPRAKTWIARQGSRTRGVLDAVSEVGRLRPRLRGLALENDKVTDLHLVGEQLFYLRRHNGEAIPSVCTRPLGGAERTLFHVRSTASAIAIATVRPSTDARFVAFGVSEGGSEDNTVHIVDASTGEELPDRLEHMAVSAVSWIPGKARFFYMRFPHFHEGDPKTRYDEPQVLSHTIGTPITTDQLVLGHGAPMSPELEAHAYPQVWAFSGSDLAIASIYRGTRPDANLFFRPLANESAPWRRAASLDDGVIDWAIAGHNLYVITRRDTPLGRIGKIDLTKATTAIEPYLESTGKVMTRLNASKDALYVLEEDVVGSGVRRVRFRDHNVAPVKSGFDAVTDIASDTGASTVALQAQGWAESARWLAVDAEHLTPTDMLPDQRKLSLPGSRVENVEVVSRDGTRVPLTILSTGDVPRDGTAPVILVGYGAYETSLVPRFGPSKLAWMERGGVIAIAHVRGGGERGRDWHIAGMREKKQNSVDDFIACAEYLVHARYASSARLGAMGSSAGGLLVGMAMAQRPELFRAVYIESGVVNLQRHLTVATGPANTEEWGSPDTVEGFKSILRMDVYQQVQKGVRFPAVLVAVGANDARVPPWQSAKLVAKLQESSASGLPVLLRVEADAGHGGDTTAIQRAELDTDIYGFMLWQFGLAG